MATVQRRGTLLVEALIVQCRNQLDLWGFSIDFLASERKYIHKESQSRQENGRCGCKSAQYVTLATALGY